MESRMDKKQGKEESILEYIEHYHPDSLLANGFDSAIIGVTTGFDSGRVVYDTRKMVEILLQEGDTTEEEAWEFLEFNTFGAWVDDKQPIYLDSF